VRHISPVFIGFIAFSVVCLLFLVTQELLVEVCVCGLRLCVFVHARVRVCLPARPPVGLRANVPTQVVCVNLCLPAGCRAISSRSHLSASAVCASACAHHINTGLKYAPLRATRAGAMYVCVWDDDVLQAMENQHGQEVWWINLWLFLGVLTVLLVESIVGLFE
jgi:hypothetical protein